MWDQVRERIEGTAPSWHTRDARLNELPALSWCIGEMPVAKIAMCRLQKLP
jgi:hypothetical protein